MATHREHLAAILRGQPSPWVPNYELGCWGQTVDRRLKEGWPEDDL